MAPRKHDDGTDSSSIDAATVSTSSSIATTSSTADTVSSVVAAVTTTSTPSPIPTALPNQPSNVPSTNQAPSTSNSGQSTTSFKVIGGIIAALVAILVIFGVGMFYLKRRWKAKELAEARTQVYSDAKARRDEEDGGGEGTAFISDKKVHDRENSLASTKSKSSMDSYLKSNKKRTSLGTQHTPGVAAEEAYMMFGGSATNLNDDDEESRPLTYHERHLSESAAKRTSWSGAPAPAPTDKRARRISLLDDDSRYPAVNASTDSVGRKMRHSVSYPPGVSDPFADSTPTGSPKAPHRAFTSGDVRTGAGSGTVTPPRGAQPRPVDPAEGRRISLKGGVGRRQSTPGSPGGGPRAAWK